MMTVTAMNAAPAIYDHRWTERTNHLDHVLQDFIAPYSFSFFGSFGVAKVSSASKKEFDAISSRCREQFLRADQTELRGLLRTQIILATFAPCQREQGHFGVETASQICEHGCGF